MELFERKPVTREEWYNSPEFIILRLFGHLSSETQMKTQEMFDVLSLIVAMCPGLYCTDRFTVVERQLKIVSLEAKRLIDEVSKLSDFLQPKIVEPNEKTS